MKEKFIKRYWLYARRVKIHSEDQRFECFILLIPPYGEFLSTWDGPELITTANFNLLIAI